MTVVNGGFGSAIACVFLIAHSTALAGESDSLPAQPASVVPATAVGKPGFDTGSILDPSRALNVVSREDDALQMPSAPDRAQFAKPGLDLNRTPIARGAREGKSNPGQRSGAGSPKLQLWNVGAATAGPVLDSRFEVLQPSWTAPNIAPAFDFGATEPARLILAAQNTPPATTGLPTAPVGEAPEMMMEPALELALPEGARVLTPTRRLVVETSYEYALTSSNRLIFRGVEIVPGILLGIIDANDVVRDTAVGALNVRYGIFDRMEIEARIPVVYRHDRFTVLSQQVTPTIPAYTQVLDLEGRDLGDIEFGFRYQLNRARTGGAIFVGGIRAKTRTGIGPYDVDYDANGVATALGTGSGFWAVEPNVTMLYPSDPVVIFMNVGYIHSFGLNIDKDIGTTHIGQVDPGGAIHTSLGFGFALNPEFSFSLGFTNTFIFGTESEIGAIKNRSNSLESAALTMGLSYVFSPNFTVGGNFEFGVTEDAPDMRVLIRLPFRF